MLFHTAYTTKHVGLYSISYYFDMFILKTYSFDKMELVQFKMGVTILLISFKFDAKSLIGSEKTK